MQPVKQKRAQVLAATIEQQIMDADWPVGEVLGSEHELLESHGVSRAVLREAVRILEHHGVAEMRKGRGGGLTVRRPDLAAMARSAALHLDYASVDDDELIEARLGVELMALDLTIERLDAGGRVALENHMAHEWEALDDRGAAPHAHDFHLLIARLSHNPVVGLLGEMLLDLQRGRQRINWPSLTVPPAIARRSVEAHQSVVDAVLAGDRDAARAAMAAHLGGLTRSGDDALCRGVGSPQAGYSDEDGVGR